MALQETTMKHLDHIDIMFYTGLSQRQTDIKEGDLIQEANTPQEVNFIFICWEFDKKYSIETAICKDKNNVRRYFFKEAIKKSDTELLKEDKEVKRIKKAEKLQLQKEKDDKRKAKLEAKRLIEEAKKKKQKYKNKQRKLKGK